jgi:hypothetical protein
MLLYKGKRFLALKHGQLVTNAPVLFSSRQQCFYEGRPAGTWNMELNLEKFIRYVCLAKIDE